jgi:hypothetical protein
VRSKASGSFLKKEPKNFWSFWGMGFDGINAHGPALKVFLLLFVHKKKRFLTSRDTDYPSRAA